MCESEGPYICYDCEGEGDATFVRVCTKCRRFVAADQRITVCLDSGLKKQPNATCKKCGRVEMEFVGFY